MLNNTVDRDTVLTKDGGGSFSIGAISLATTNVVSGSFDLLFTGTKSDNSTVDQTFSIDNTTYALENLSVFIRFHRYRVPAMDTGTSVASI